MRFDPSQTDVALLKRLVRSLEARLSGSWESFPSAHSRKAFFDPSAWADSLDARRDIAGGIPVTWSRTLLAPPRPLLVSFFADGMKITAEPLARSGIGVDLTRDLSHSGLIETDASGALVSRIRLTRLFGSWFVSDPARDLSSDAVYIGRDSVLLAARATRFPGGRVLDAYAGTGVQGILFARRGADVVITELNTRAVAMCRLNLALSGLSRSYLVRADSLSGLRGRFDTILINPPYGAVTESNRALALSHEGGVFGDEETIGILGELPPLLAPGGRALIVGTFPFDKGAPRFFQSPSGLDLAFDVDREDLGSRGIRRFFGLIRATSGSGRRTVVPSKAVRRSADLLSRILRGVTRPAQPRLR